MGREGRSFCPGHPACPWNDPLVRWDNRTQASTEATINVVFADRSREYFSRHPAASASRAERWEALVSVIIPCYNSARYLAETIESVLAQTYPRVEIILIDDGSSDETANIAQGYPLNYVYQTNRGISAARNTGVLHSQGKYVLFLDHDDRLCRGASKPG